MITNSHSSRLAVALAACLLLSLALTSCNRPEVADVADTIVVNARVATMDPAQRNVQAFAIRGDRIIAVGDAKTIRALEGPQTEVIDAGANFVMPGFIESHGHFRGLGAMRRLVDLVGTKSYDEVIARCVAAADKAPPGQWIVGRGWDQNHWASKKMPQHGKLSEALPDHPVMLSRVDGHALLANAAAMKAAGVTAETKSPSGGEILRDEKGAPTGVFVDLAEKLIASAVPAPSAEQIQADLLAAQEEAFSYGITTFHDCGASTETIQQMRRLYDISDLKIRLYVMVGGSGTTEIDFKALGPPLIGGYGSRFSLRTIKVGVDGALGSRGAALLEDYSDRPGHRGLTLMSSQQLESISREALQRGWQVAVHAIGDRGNRMALDVWTKLFKEFPGGRRARFRMEHAQVLDGADIPRLAELGVIASMQPCHGTSDLAWAAERLGQARVEEGAYAWQKIIKSGAVLCSGTDAPVEPVSPFNNLYAALVRDFGEGKPTEGYHAEQRLNRRQALASYTTAGAYASFEEAVKGRIAPGMFADFIIVNRDLEQCSDEDVRDARVLKTFVAGKVVYTAR